MQVEYQVDPVVKQLGFYYSFIVGSWLASNIAALTSGNGYKS